MLNVELGCIHGIGWSLTALHTQSLHVPTANVGFSANMGGLCQCKPSKWPLVHC
jgi:hypothetical protein